MTAHGSVETAVKAMHLGALDYVEKPFPLTAMEAKVEKALERLKTEQENRRLKDELQQRFGSLIGGSPPMQRVFELIERAYGFSPFAAQVICSDPNTTEEELAAFFPQESEHKGYAGCLMVYPRGKVASKLEVPSELTDDAYFEKHDLFVPATPKVAERVGFGNHYGTVFFHGEDPRRMEELFWKWEEFDFYS
mgnify:CR=1 FL=1